MVPDEKTAHQMMTRIMTEHARLRLQDGRLRHWLNGVKTLEVDFFSGEFWGLVAESRFATMPDFARPRRGHVAQGGR